MNLFTVILLTGTLNGQGEVISIKKTPTNHHYAQLSDCKKYGAGMAASVAKKQFRSSGQMHRKQQSKSAKGIFVGMFCKASTGPSPVSPMGGKESVSNNKLGITIYDKVNYTGQRAMIYQSDRNLFDNLVKNRQASSVIIPKGCYAILYANPDFKGTSVTLYSNTANLGQTRLGDNKAMSVRMSCTNANTSTPTKPVSEKQAILYSKVNFKGNSAVFKQQHPNLKLTPVGRNKVSSLKVDDGCKLTLYSKGNYSGSQSVFYKDRANLYGTSIGDDRADSLKLTCHESIQTPKPSNNGWKPL